MNYQITVFDCETTKPEYVGTFEIDHSTDSAEAVRERVEGKLGIFLVVTPQGTHYLALTLRGYVRYTTDCVTLTDQPDGSVNLQIFQTEDSASFPA